MPELHIKLSQPPPAAGTFYKGTKRAGEIDDKEHTLTVLKHKMQHEERPPAALLEGSGGPPGGFRPLPCGRAHLADVRLSQASRDGR